MIRIIIAATTLLAIAFVPLAIADRLMDREIDYESLLKRTDEIEVCYSTLKKLYPLADVHKTEKREVIWSSCKCWSDTVKLTLEQAGVIDPVLKNAIVQVTSNMEVYDETIGHIEPFRTFLKQEAPKRLGFSKDDFRDALVRQDALVVEIGENHIGQYQVDNVKACRNYALQAAKLRERHPDWEMVSPPPRPLNLD